MEKNLWRPGLCLAVLAALLSSGGLEKTTAFQQEGIAAQPETGALRVATYVPGEILVKFKSSVPKERIRNIHARVGVIQSQPLGMVGLERVKLPGALSVETAIALYKDNPDVEYAEPNYIRRAFFTPRDPGFSHQWSLHNTGQILTGTFPPLLGLTDADIDAIEAWDLKRDAPNLVVAVIDSGVDYTHPDLSSNIWINPNDASFGWNFARKWSYTIVNGQCSNPSPSSFPENNDPMDDFGHGTAAAGVIAAEGNNFLGIAGVLWSAKIMPLKFLGSVGCGSVGDEVQAITYAINNGARIIVVNAGGSAFDQSEYDAIQAAGNAGILVVAPAGNDGSNNDGAPVYPASYQLPNLISVAASDFNDHLAYFSNFGPTSVDLAAPGDCIYTTMPTGNFILQPAKNYPAGTNPASVAVGDFNGDGNLDLAVANNGSSDVSILLGNGDGTFGAATNYPVGTSPTSVAVGDFDGDGKLDLAVANNGSNDVSILLGDGTGAFVAVGSPIAVGTGPDSVAVGDFDGDGKLDLAVANNGSNDVSILLGNGDGTFGAATDYAVGTSPASVAVGDISGDGRPDLAVANGTSNTVSILINTGTGFFGAATNYAVGTSPASVAVGNFNGDGRPDLAVANGAGNTVSILLGTGTGTFTLQSDTNLKCAQDRTFTKDYDYISGTSFAASHVAGVAGLLLSQDPGLTPAQLKAILVSTVDPKSGLKNMVASGGRLNAYRALTRDTGSTLVGGTGAKAGCGGMLSDGGGSIPPATAVATLLIFSIPLLLASRKLRKMVRTRRTLRNSALRSSF